MHRLWVALAAMLAISLTGCGYNTIQTQDEQVKAGWSEVVNQYQRRADLVPNLVNTVKGYASHEREVLTQVTEARARVGSNRSHLSYSTTRRPLPNFRRHSRRSLAPPCSNSTMRRPISH